MLFLSCKQGVVLIRTILLYGARKIETALTAKFWFWVNNVLICNFSQGLILSSLGTIPTLISKVLRYLKENNKTYKNQEIGFY